MASQKISAMTAATTLDLTEVIPLVQSSTNKKVTLANLFLLSPVIKRDDTSSAGSFTNAGTGANGGVIVCSTTGSLKGIEFHTSATGSGSGVRIRASSSGLLIDVRSNSATWSNAFNVDLNGNATFGNDTIGGALFLRGNFDNYVACYRVGTLLWFSGTASNYGFATDWVVYNATTSNPTIRINNTTDVVTISGDVALTANKTLTASAFTLTRSAGGVLTNTIGYLNISQGADDNILIDNPFDKNIYFRVGTGYAIAMRLQSVSGVARLGFYAATPVAQPVLATGAGATVDDVITKLQLLGLCTQS